MLTEIAGVPTHVFGDEDDPTVLLLMDGIGMRPALIAMAERLAAGGYRVRMPDLFHRMAPYTAPDPAKLFGDPAVRDDWFKRTRAAVTPALAMQDVGKVIAGCAQVGVTGYCM